MDALRAHEVDPQNAKSLSKRAGGASAKFPTCACARGLAFVLACQVELWVS